MNVLAFTCWLFMNPLRELKEISASALKGRLIMFLLLIVCVIAALVYTKFLLPKSEAKVPSGEPVLNRTVAMSEQLRVSDSTWQRTYQ